METRPIQRTSPNDLMELAAESAEAPMQVAAILVLDRPVEMAALRSALADRITAVRRFRQRLQRVPFGCGRPVWVDDTNFDIDRHLVQRQCPEPGDETALLQVAATVAVDPLPRDRPLWFITMVHNLAHQQCALIIVIHHVLADGIGGLAALGLLVDGAQKAPGPSFPAPPPTVWELLADSTHARWHSARRLPTMIRLVREACQELWGDRIGHPTPCSLNQPTGLHRQLAVARTNLPSLLSSAHTHKATVNDILLTAVSGALAGVLRSRGESADAFVFSVPVSGRPETAATELGNQVGAMLVRVSATTDTPHLLADIAQTTRARRHALGRGASAILLEPAFRVMSQMGAFRWYVNRQRMITTLVTNLRGPQSPIKFLGATVLDIIPVSQITGNVTVSFVAMSYCGSLGVTIIADPEHCPDLHLIHRELRSQLDKLAKG